MCERDIRRHHRGGGFHLRLLGGLHSRGGALDPDCFLQTLVGGLHSRGGALDLDLAGWHRLARNVHRGVTWWSALTGVGALGTNVLRAIANVVGAELSRGLARASALERILLTTVITRAIEIGLEAARPNGVCHRGAQKHVLSVLTVPLVTAVAGASKT